MSLSVLSYRDHSVASLITTSRQPQRHLDLYLKIISTSSQTPSLLTIHEQAPLKESLYPLFIPTFPFSLFLCGQ